MGIYAEKKEGDFKQVEPGTYVARCYSMIELGTIETEFNGEKKSAHRVLIHWELPTELEVFREELGQQPYSVSKEYTLSMHEKSNLRRDLESWRGKTFTESECERFDITKLLSKPCILNIIHEAGKKDTSKKYVKVASVNKMMKGQECPEQINPSRILSFDEFNWDMFNSLPDWIKDKIKSSEEYQMIEEPETVNARSDNDDPKDLPF